MARSARNAFSYPPPEQCAQAVSEDTYDLLVATCGYESRATHVSREIDGRVARLEVFGYPDQNALAFDSNLDYFRSRGNEPDIVSAGEFGLKLAELFRELTRLRGSTVAVDISSLNRQRIAAVIHALQQVEVVNEFEVTFFYSIGTFDSHTSETDSMVLVNAPLFGFEGWSRDPAEPVAAVVGLGFENLQALAALETLEPSRTIAFVAQSPDSRFQERVLNDNQQLIRSTEITQVQYNVEDAFSSLHQLESVVFALKRRYRVAIVPLGPKIFALLSLLVAAQYPDELAVWRVSADTGGEPLDRLALGPITVLRIRLGPPGPIATSLE